MRDKIEELLPTRYSERSELSKIASDIAPATNDGIEGNFGSLKQRQALAPGSSTARLSSAQIVAQNHVVECLENPSFPFVQQPFRAAAAVLRHRRLTGGTQQAED